MVMTKNQAIKAAILIYNPTEEDRLNTNCLICNGERKRHFIVSCEDCFANLVDYFTIHGLYEIVKIIKTNNCKTVKQVKQKLMLKKLENDTRSSY